MYPSAAHLHSSPTIQYHLLSCPAHFLICEVCCTAAGSHQTYIITHQASPTVLGPITSSQITPHRQQLAIAEPCTRSAVPESKAYPEPGIPVLFILSVTSSLLTASTAACGPSCSFSLLTALTLSSRITLLCLYAWPRKDSEQRGP